MLQKLNPPEVVRQVNELARHTGDFIRTERLTFSLGKVEYKQHNDLVSYVDKTAEVKIIEGLRKIIPEAGFITEENTVERIEHEYTWIVDPLDGTTNFVHGIPCFCICIALQHKKEIVAGTIYEINLDECFYAWKDGGAYLNEQPIQVSTASSLKESLMATGFPYNNYDRMIPYMKIFDHCMHHTHGLRRLGSAAADLAYVACGRFEGFYEYGLNAWDVAAGAIIVKEAGGTVADFSGNSNYIFGKEIVATNKNIFNEFMMLIKKEFANA